jgi:hypothetical protein
MNGYRLDQALHSSSPLKAPIRFFFVCVFFFGGGGVPEHKNAVISSRQLRWCQKIKEPQTAPPTGHGESEPRRTGAQRQHRDRGRPPVGAACVRHLLLQLVHARQHPACVWGSDAPSLNPPPPPNSSGGRRARQPTALADPKPSHTTRSWRSRGACSAAACAHGQRPKQRLVEQSRKWKCSFACDQRPKCGKDKKEPSPTLRGKLTTPEPNDRLAAHAATAQCDLNQTQTATHTRASKL